MHATEEPSDAEIGQYQAADGAFSEAFAKGYTDGKRRLAAGEARRADVGPLVIEVDMFAVRGGRWQNDVPRFQELGERAAMSALRTLEARLEGPGAHAPRFDEPNYRWRVVPNAQGPGPVAQR